MSDARRHADNILVRLSAILSGALICAGSLWLTCRYIVLYDTSPNFVGQWFFNPETLFFIAKIAVGGFGVSAAQILSRIIHRRTGEKKYLALYWFATSVSVFVSIHTFYTGNKIGAVQAKYSTAQYETLLQQKELREASLMTLQGEFRTYLAGEYERKKAKYWFTIAEGERQAYLEKIKEATEKVDEVTDKLLNYQDNDAKETVTNDSTYENIAHDIVVLASYWYDVDPRSEEIIVILMNYFILISFSLIADICGPFLVAYGVVGPRGKRRKEEKGNDFIRKLWYAATNQPVPLDADKEKELDRLRARPFSKLRSHELKMLLKDAKSVVDVIPTLKTRIFMEAAPDSGKTTLIQMLIKQAMARGEMTPDNSQLYIFDLQDAEKGKWPYWANLYGLNQNIESVKEGFTQLKALKDQGKQKKHVFVIVDEGMEMAAMYEEKYKKALGTEYSWIISFARQKGFGLLFSTVVGTGKAVGTEGMARIKGAYAYKINLLYHPVSKIRCALLQVGGIEPDYYRVPHIRDIDKITRPGLTTLVRTTASQALSGTTQVVRKLHQAGTEKLKTVPVEYESVPETYQAFTGGTDQRTTPVPPVPVENQREIRKEENKIVPLRTTHSENRTTFNGNVPGDIRKAYQQVTEEQERTILDMVARGESDNNIIKEVFGSKPTPKFRKWLKAVKWMNGIGRRERMAK